MLKIVKFNIWFDIYIKKCIDDGILALGFGISIPSDIEGLPNIPD